MNEFIEGFFRALELIVTLDPEVVGITLRSLRISVIATLFASLMAIPLGSLIAFREFRGKKVLINSIQTLYALPTVIVGLLVFMILSRSGPLGELGLLFTPAGMVIGQTLLILPILLGLMITALSGVPPVIRDTIISLGATKFQYLSTILKEARFAIVAAIVMGFGRAISEVGVAIMIGGNIRNHTRVLTTAISLETSMGNIELSIALGLILLGIALFVNTVLSLFQHR